MIPTIAGPDGTDESDEPGGSTCQKCREDIEPGEHAYREVFGEVDHPTEHGVVFGTTGGVVVRHYCEDCYREHRQRDKAAHYEVVDPERLWAMLDASDGELVADCAPLFVGSRPYIRVVDGEAEGVKIVADADRENKILRFEPERFDVSKERVFAVLRAERNHPDGARVLLKPLEETPFMEFTDQSDKRMRQHSSERA